MITDLRNADFVSFHIRPSILDETWGWVKRTLELSVDAGTLTSDGFVSCVDLGFIRTSEGSRYNKTLHPSIDNKTVPVPGGDGSYYFGMFWKDRSLTISIAYDAMTEKQIRAITLLFAGDRKMWDIYFDEEPYKVYHVKLVQPITLNYICIDDINDDSVAPAHLIHNHELGDSAEDAPAPQSQGRLYKGEGSIQIQAFTPFARQRWKYLKSYDGNVNEWSSASRLLYDHWSYSPAAETTINYNEWVATATSTTGPGVYNLWNPGDVETDWTLVYQISEIPSTGLEISNTSMKNGMLIEDEDGSVHKLCINKVSTIGSDTHIRINSALNIIEGGTYAYDYYVYEGDLDDGGTYYVYNQNTKKYVETSDIARNPDETYYKRSEGYFVPSGTVYDRYRAEGKYFKINRGESRLELNRQPTRFDYNYKYF